MSKKLYIWHSEHEENTCDECKKLDGKIFKNRQDAPDLPLHPNCKCTLENVNKEDFEQRRKQRKAISLFLIGGTEIKAGETRKFPKERAYHFYEKNGVPYEMNYLEIKKSPTIQDLGKQNIEKHLTNHLNGKQKDNNSNIKKNLEFLKDGESITFKTYWNSAIQELNPLYPYKDMNTFLSLGSFQVKSYIEGIAFRKNNIIYIQGKSQNILDDIYDFSPNNPLTLNEYLAEQEGTGQPYHISAKWISRFRGEVNKFRDGTIGNAVLKEYILDEDNKKR